MNFSKENEYLDVFTAKNGKDYGVRPATEEDASALVPIFKDEYGYNYLYPWVYDPEAFQKQIRKKNQYWFLAEVVDTREACATVVMNLKRPYSLLAGKLTSKRSSRGIGILSNLGSAVFTMFLTSSQFKDLLRFDSDIRATSISSQRFAEHLSSIAYGFIPNYNNYDDKRNWDITKGKPFSTGTIEPVVMAVAPLNSFWAIRWKDIVLYDDPDILYFHTKVREMAGEMEDDTITIKNSSSIEKDDFEIVEDIYKSCVAVNGCITSKKLDQILKRYQDWNCIEWRIPATLDGLYSQKMALEKGFIVAGYDPGSFFSDRLVDSLLVCAFPNGVNDDQFDGIKLTEKNKPLADKVREELENQQD